MDILRDAHLCSTYILHCTQADICLHFNDACREFKRKKDSSMSHSFYFIFYFVLVKIVNERNKHFNFQHLLTECECPTVDD